MFTEYTDDEGVIHTVEAQQAAFVEQQALQRRQTMNVTPFQAKAALLQAALLDDVEALISDPAADPLVKLAWTNALEYRRLSPMVEGIKTALGWTDEQLDSLFEQAALISA